jgi:hypothetical protein
MRGCLQDRKNSKQLFERTDLDSSSQHPTTATATMGFFSGDCLGKFLLVVSGLKCHTD